MTNCRKPDSPSPRPSPQGEGEARKRNSPSSAVARTVWGDGPPPQGEAEGRKSNSPSPRPSPQGEGEAGGGRCAWRDALLRWAFVFTDLLFPAKDIVSIRFQLGLFARVDLFVRSCGPNHDFVVGFKDISSAIPDEAVQSQ